MRSPVKGQADNNRIGSFNPAVESASFALGCQLLEAGEVGEALPHLKLAAQAAGVPHVILADSRLEDPIDAALSGMGTHIWREVAYAEHTA